MEDLRPATNAVAVLARAARVPCFARISPGGRGGALPGLAAWLAMGPCIAYRLQGLRAGRVGHVRKPAAMVRAPRG